MRVEVGQEKEPSKGEGKQSSKHPRSSEKPTKMQLTELSHDTEQHALDSGEDLLGVLIGKIEPKSPIVKHQEAAKESSPEIDGLFGKAQKTVNGDRSGRVVLILNRLKKLPAEFLEARPGGITKVVALGLKNTKLELKDCVSVLKAADLLGLVDGHETAVDSTGKGASRYFLVKADLLDGK